ncbi:MAG: glycosyltransferase, partial [Planctomycetota bacterium]
MSVSSPRRLGYVISGREQYGPRRAALGLCDELRARGWAVHIYAIEDGPFARELREQRYPCDALSERGIPLVGGSPAARAAGALRMLRGARALRAPLAQRIARDRVDLLHVRWPNLVAIAGHAAHSAGVPTIWQLPNIVGDGHPFDLNKRFFRRLCRTRSVLPLGNSLYTARTLGGDIEPRFLHLAVDQTLFDPDRYTPGVDGAPTRADVGLPDGAIVLGIFARISPQKGADRIARAI